MRKARTKNIVPMLICVVTVLSMVLWAAPGFCQGGKTSVVTGGKASVQAPADDALAPGAVAVQSSGTYCDCDCDCGCDDGKRSGDGINTLRRNMSNTACFNCKVNGSYKYPVPKQYTYFWPGIYSQKRMTDYVSPYQGLRLESPAKVFNEK